MVCVRPTVNTPGTQYSISLLLPLKSCDIVYPGSTVIQAIQRAYNITLSPKNVCHSAPIGRFQLRIMLSSTWNLYENNVIRCAAIVELHVGYKYKLGFRPIGFYGVFRPRSVPLDALTGPKLCAVLVSCSCLQSKRFLKAVRKSLLSSV